MTSREQSTAASGDRAPSGGLERLLSRSPLTVYSCDPRRNYRLTAVSENVERQFGYSVEEFLAEPAFYFSRIHPRDAGRIFAGLDTLTRFGNQVFEYRLRRKDGGYRWVRDDLVLYFDDAGEPMEIVGGLIDITETKRAERALRESDQRLRDIAELSADWIWETDADNRYTFVSERLAEITGQPVVDYIGRSRFETLADAVDPAKVAAHIEDIRAHRPFRDFEYWINLDDGRRCVSLSGKPMLDHSGQFCGYRGTGTDVTARRLAEDSLRDAKEEAEAASQAKTRFLAHMSHELRTPLNAIIGFSDVIRREMLGPVNGRYVEYGEDIHASGQHLLLLINDILDLSKIEAGRLDIRDEQVDVGHTIEQVVRLLRDRAFTKEIKLTMEVADGLPNLRSEERVVKQILLNLLSNAVKFTPHGGQVLVRAEVDDTGDMVIQVRDNGIGIAAHDLPNVLRPFEQAADANTSFYEGTGLGLPLVKSFVEIHGGDLVLESEVGTGTTATVRLPAERIIRDVVDSPDSSAGSGG